MRDNPAPDSRVQYAEKPIFILTATLKRFSDGYNFQVVSFQSRSLVCIYTWSLFCAFLSEK